MVTKSYIINHRDETCYFKYKNHTVLHREDGPAVNNNRTQEWWVNGQRHRVDGPALLDVDGYKAWYQNGYLHRLDGPAVEHQGYEAFYITGRFFHAGRYHNGRHWVQAIVNYVSHIKVTKQDIKTTIGNYRIVL